MGEGAGHTRVRACIQTPRTHGKSGTEECSCLPGVQHGQNPGSLQPTSPADTASKRPVPNKVQSEEHPNVHNPHVCSYKQHTYAHTNKQGSLNRLPRSQRVPEKNNGHQREVLVQGTKKRTFSRKDTKALGWSGTRME